MLSSILVSALLALPGYQTPTADGPLATVAEKSNFKATATSDDVVQFGKRLAAASKLVRVSEIGKTTEGRPLPLWIVADPPINDPAAAKESDKLVVCIIANIHAGEVDGKEAIGIYLRELLREEHPALLKNVVLLVVPNYNPDGNDAFSKDNRPGQDGPADGMGKRSNGQGLDLNRDFVKLDAPETRALLKLFNTADPHLFMDLHTTDGSYHRYTLTYQGPLNPNGDQRIIDYTRSQFLPTVGKEMKAKNGWDSFFYGNFEENHTLWTSYPDWPRFGTNYVGMRNRISILSESYSYAPFKDRVLVTRDFVRECLAYASARKDEIRKLLTAARDEVAAAKPGGPVSIESVAQAFPNEVEALGFEEGMKGPKTFKVKHVQDFKIKTKVNRPYAYLIPGKYAHAIHAMQRHGFDMVELREDISLDVEAATVKSVERAPRAYEGHVLVKVGAEPRPITRMVEAGTVLVKTAQPLGNLAVYFLEPSSSDNLATWGMFDDGLSVGADFPVLRLPALPPYSFQTGPVKPLPEDRVKKKLDASAMAGIGGFGGRRGGGGAISGEWVDDEHWLRVGVSGLEKVEARTGRTSPAFDFGPVEKAIAKIPGINAANARTIARSGYATGDKTKPGFHFVRDDDLYYASFDGKSAVRLTKSPGEEEMPTFSPDGRYVAFVRDNDLYAVDVATQTERRLTEGGTDKRRNGKADWVYYEEIFNRDWQAFWWSPDSTHIGFLQIDDAPVKNHEVVNDIAPRREVELTAYPRAGDPNPTVRFGLLGVVAKKPIRWLEVSASSKEDRLVSKVSWLPNSSNALVHVQDRSQTFLDATKVSPDPKVPPSVFFRQTTKAWVEPFEGPFPLPDGTFVVTSERSGWKHLDLHAADGKLIRAVTSGDWEIRGIEKFDPKAGTFLISATKDNPIATNLYRVSIKDGSIVRLTHGGGGHSVRVNPSGTLFVDTWSDPTTPNQFALIDGGGKKVRTLSRASHNPLDAYRLGERERVQIKARDGFVLEGEVILPPDLDPKKLYPVWFMTYGGPHTPTISDSWGGGRVSDHLMAADGIIVFRMDPRSASGKGAVSTWSAYRRLGVQELEDIKDGINWLKQRPYVDGSRIGMAGHSYGGFMTAYAMTHSDLFSCGIAGAPVTDWHDYDSIYTERFMDTPQRNPKGYAETSVVSAASKLHGRLLIAHGMMDDNVSVRNSMRLINALQNANKDFDIMIYPTARHGIFSPHYTRLQSEFIRKHLGGPKDRPR